jgi:chemotaxis protein CheD
MIKRMREMDAFHKDIEIKVFGGAAQFIGHGGRKSRKTVGEQNIEAARRILSEYGVDIQAMQVGGTSGRKIIFDTSDGAVFLKKIKPN